MWLAVETRNRIVLGAPKWLIKGMRRNLIEQKEGEKRRCQLS